MALAFALGMGVGAGAHLTAGGPARAAGIPVVDVAAIGEMVSNGTLLAQQLVETKNMVFALGELTQALGVAAAVSKLRDALSDVLGFGRGLGGKLDLGKAIEAVRGASPTKFVPLDGDGQPDPGAASAPSQDDYAGAATWVNEHLYVTEDEAQGGVAVLRPAVARLAVERRRYLRQSAVDAYAKASVVPQRLEDFSEEQTQLKQALENSDSLRSDVSVAVFAILAATRSQALANQLLAEQLKIESLLVISDSDPLPHDDGSGP